MKKFAIVTIIIAILFAFVFGAIIGQATTTRAFIERLIVDVVDDEVRITTPDGNVYVHLVEEGH